MEPALPRSHHEAVQALGQVPEDLGGYQAIEAGDVALGDLVLKDDRKEWAAGLIGVTIEQATRNGWRVYRKMPCPRQTGDEAYKSPAPALALSAKALTHDDGKPPLAVLPWAALDEMALVQAYGHRKYGDFYNYRKGMEVSRQLSCAVRHIRDYMNGHDKDHESGLNPLAHALCRIAFVLQNIADGKAIDDRYKPTT